MKRAREGPSPSGSPAKAIKTEEGAAAGAAAAAAAAAAAGAAPAPLPHGPGTTPAAPGGPPGQAAPGEEADTWHMPISLQVCVCVCVCVCARAREQACSSDSADDGCLKQGIVGQTGVHSNGCAGRCAV
eukprot:1161053-Pelagomonas_calceolata.AAC.17